MPKSRTTAAKGNRPQNEAVKVTIQLAAMGAALPKRTLKKFMMPPLVPPQQGRAGKNAAEAARKRGRHGAA